MTDIPDMSEGLPFGWRIFDPDIDTYWYDDDYWDDANVWLASHEDRPDSGTLSEP